MNAQVRAPRSVSTDSASWHTTMTSDRSSTTTPGMLHEAMMAEDDVKRNMRVFGGSTDEAGSMELCGPMLDVVLGLFGGVDYED